MKHLREAEDNIADAIMLSSPETALTGASPRLTIYMRCGPTQPCVAESSAVVGHVLLPSHSVSFFG